MILATFVIVANGLISAPQRQFTGLGPHTRKVTTISPSAQKFFNQGLNFLYGFNHDEAKRSFKAATQFDANCAMAWWGIAMANGPHINNPSVSPENAKSAVTALKKATALIGRASAVEQALIRAASKRFKIPQPEDRSALDRAYAVAMAGVWKKYPKDADVGALYAEAEMDLLPWKLWSHDGKPSKGTMNIVGTLQTVMEMSPKHPLALHLYIHAVEASPNPQWASKAANTLRTLMPGLGHMVHMPSHIDVRTGLWSEAIRANERAITADSNYLARSQPPGFYRLYMAHNHHMLGFAASMVGQSESAIQAMDALVSEMPPEWLIENGMFADGFMVMPLEARVRFGWWEDVLAYEDFSEAFPISRALRRAARGVAFAATGRPAEARKELANFNMLKKKPHKDAFFGNNLAVDIFAVAYRHLLGEILLAEGKINNAIQELRLGATAEDKLGYDEPPDWFIPVRHTLGAVLLRAGKAVEAERVYREDLKRFPDNGWSLYGLSKAMAARGKTADATRIKAKFDVVWKNADIKIEASCLCVKSR